MRLPISFPYRNRLASLAILISLAFLATTANWTGVAAKDEAWRPLDPADLALKTPLVEPDAGAEAIFWEIQIDDAGEDDLVLSHYVRIKIFNELGRDKQSKIDIPFFGKTKIKDVSARTIRRDGSIVELAKADILEKIVVQVSGLKLRMKSFAFAGIEPGAIIEYKWKEVISNASANNMRLPFQRDIPVQSITYRIKPSKSLGTFDVRAFNMPKTVSQKEKDGFWSITLKHMPAFREEPLMPPSESVRAWAMVRYRSFFAPVTAYTDFATRVYFGFQPYMEVDGEIKRKADELTAGASTPEEKLEKIFTFCRTNIKNTNNKSSGFSDEELEKIKENKKPADTLKRGTGPGIDINLLFAALANAAGFEAHVALLPDRGRRLFDRNVAIPGALVPTNVAVRVGTSWKFFDLSPQYFTPGMLRWQHEGVDALIADAPPSWVTTPMSPPQKSKEKRVAKLRLDENGTLEGDVSIEFTGHLAVEKKTLNDEDSPAQREENLKEAVKKRLSTAELTNIVIENVSDPAKPVSYKYHVRVPDYAQRTGKRLFFQPGFFHKGIGALFTAGTRRHPIYFHFPWSEEDDVTISLPKGYALDNADRPSPISAGGICKYEVNMGISSAGTTLFYKRDFFFGGEDAILFPVDRYELIKRLFDEINQSDTHLITLKQSEPAK